MPFVQAKCINCGATLAVDDAKDAAICPFCNTPYIVEKAINYYNTANHITADVVNVYGGVSDFVIRAGTLERYIGESTTAIIPNTVSIIGDKAFEGCSGLVSVTIPTSVTRIGNLAFRNCSSLKEISIPDSVKSIGRQAFIGCNGIKHFSIPKSVSEWDGAFADCTWITDIQLENGIKNIGIGTFQGCTDLKAIVLPNGLLNIEAFAFHKAGLETIIVPESVTSIGEGAFSDCQKLRRIELPASVLSNKNKLFCYRDSDNDYCGECFELTEIFISGSLVQANVRNRDLILNCLRGTGLHVRLRDIYEVYKQDRMCPYCGGDIKKNIRKGNYYCSQCEKVLTSRSYSIDSIYYVGLSYNLGKQHYDKVKSSSWYNEKFVEIRLDHDLKLDEKPSKWVCTICGEIHEGVQPPEQCKICNQPANMFRKV